ncbi:MAG: hypothetical protein JJV98_16415, partial [Desulfosarcina sp.]|nr:hypothetical protein [Desulfobacterales bacterium]
RHYRRILEDVPKHPEALFNTGIALQHQGDPARENEAWKAYLDFFDRGQQAIQAVEYLNANDDFTFRRIQLGPLEIVKRSITFNPGQTFLDETAQATLDAIGRVVARNRKLQLHVVAYADNDAKAAKFRAIGIKRHLTEHFADISPQRIKPSWFGVSEKVQIEDGTHQLESSIRLFATIIDES